MEPGFDAAASPLAQATPLARPRFEFYLTGEDNLRISSVNSLTGVVLTVSGRLYDPTQGVIVPFVRTHVPNSDRTIKRTIESLGVGYILDLTVRATTGTPLAGQTYVILEIVRGLLGAVTLVGTLAADYVTSTRGLGWPGSPIRSSLEAEPMIREFGFGGSPAGIDIGAEVPTGARWEVLAVRANLIAGAAVANRSVSLIMQTPGGNFAQIPPAAVQTAGQSVIYSWAPGLNTQSDAALLFQTQALPQRALLPQLGQIRTVTLNMQAADQWNAPRGLVREWLEVL